MAIEAPMINKENVSEAEKLLVQSFNNLIAFGKLFLPGDFMKSETPLFHYEIAEELIRHSNKPCAMILPRGHGKTTLVKAKVVRDICFAKKAYEWGLADEERDLFFGWVSSNQRKSQNNVAYVKLNLELNEKINYYFGKLPHGTLRGHTWNQEDLVTAYGDRLISSSNLTSMRGDTLATLKSGAVRYTCVFVDDAENEDNTRTESSREKIVDNILNGIMPAIEQNQPDTRLFFIGTPVHYDSMIQNILDRYSKIKDDPEALDKFSWKVLTWSATQPDMPGGVLWDSWMPRKKLDEIKQRYVDSPRGVGGYYQEYELQVQSLEDALFSRKNIKYWNGYYTFRDGHSFIFVNGDFVPVNTFLGCDPATDIDTRHSDFSVIMVIAVDAQNNVYVLDYERHRSIPTIGSKDSNGALIGKKGVVDYIIEMYEKYHCRNGVVEDVAMNRSVMQSLNDERRRLNKWRVAIIPEKPGGSNKINRIYSGLASRFSSGSIYLKESHYDLINEILKFGPKMAHDDTIETLYYACMHAFPIGNIKREDFTGDYIKKKREAKSWIIA